MKKQLILFWVKVMIWESNRLRRKTNRLADKLSKACERQAKHNDRLANTEQLFSIINNAVTKSN